MSQARAPGILRDASAEDSEPAQGLVYSAIRARTHDGEEYSVPGP